MSYLTKLHIRAVSGTTEERIAVLDKISECLELSSCSKDDYTIRDEYYRCSVDEDIEEAAILTKDHPDVIVEVVAEGEERADLWRARMQDGRYERVDAEIDDTLPPFREILLPNDKPSQDEKNANAGAPTKKATTVYSAVIVERDGFGDIGIHQFVSDCPGGNLNKIHEFLNKQSSERGLELQHYKEADLLKFLNGENEDGQFSISVDNCDTSFTIKAMKAIL